MHMVQPMPLPLTVSCFTKIQIGFTILVLAHPGSPGQRAIKRVCVCVCILTVKLQSVMLCTYLELSTCSHSFYRSTFKRHLKFYLFQSADRRTRTHTDTGPQSVPTLAQRRAGNWLVHLQVSIMGNMRKTRCRAKPNVSTLAACVQRISSVDKTDRNSLPWQRPLRDRKTNFRLFISSQSSTNSENLAKIGPVVIL